MRRLMWLFALAVSLSLITPGFLLRAQNRAPSPPMGWSEWDSYGLGITESEFRANAEVLAGLRQYGWQYALLDAGWYMDSRSSDRAAPHYNLDASGRLIPAPGRFPSASPGVAPLAAWLHARGLKFGIHVMLGIPRQAVAANLPIAGSEFHAAQAADTSATCPWDKEFYVVADNAAGQAYYDSIARLYAGWGVDFIKLGCVSDHPFRWSEIRQISRAIHRTRRPMILSLSPGPPPQQYVPLVERYAQMWRVGAEHWDFWTTPPGTPDSLIGLRDAFGLFARWSPFVKPGNWVDGDALPDGWLGPHPPVGQARHSRLTEDEQRTEFALWAFDRAPLIEGANLTRMDETTRALMTDRELLDIDQHATESHPITTSPFDSAETSIWEAQTNISGKRRYFAFFNLRDQPVTLQVVWSRLGLQGGVRRIRDVGNDRTEASESTTLRLAPHGCAIDQVQ
jgi:alpha-galactosidase